jgi:hypothetical protein
MDMTYCETFARWTSKKISCYNSNRVNPNLKKIYHRANLFNINSLKRGGVMNPIVCYYRSSVKYGIFNFQLCQPTRYTSWTVIYRIHVRVAAAKMLIL